MTGLSPFGSRRGPPGCAELGREGAGGDHRRPADGGVGGAGRGGGRAGRRGRRVPAPARVEQRFSIASHCSTRVAIINFSVRQVLAAEHDVRRGAQGQVGAGHDQEAAAAGVGRPACEGKARPALPVGARCGQRLRSRCRSVYKTCEGERESCLCLRSRCRSVNETDAFARASAAVLSIRLTPSLAVLPQRRVHAANTDYPQARWP